MPYAPVHPARHAPCAASTSATAVATGSPFELQGAVRVIRLTLAELFVLRPWLRWRRWCVRVRGS